MEGSFQNEGLELHYKALGHGAPLLCLSGGPGFDPDYLLPLARELGKSNLCILLEQRGTGRSQPSRLNSTTINLQLYLSDFEALRKHLGFERWAVLGHSYGGFLAMNCMTVYPGSISRALQVGTNPPAEHMMQGLADDLSLRLTPDENKKTAMLAAELLKQKSDRALFAYFQVVLPAYFFDREKGRAFAAALQPAEIHYATFAALTMENPGYDLRAALASLSLPVLILHGRQDIVNLMMPYEVNRAIPSSSMKILGKCGHFPWLEQPAEFYAAALEFLQQTQ